MKTFKFSSMFLSVMTVLSLAVLFTSCSKENLTTDVEKTANTVNQENATKILLPEEITSQGTEAIKEYLKNMSDEQKIKHINDYTISEYLTKKNKLKGLDSNGKKVGLPKDLNLSDYLTGDEIQELKAKLISPEDVANDERIQALLQVDCYDVYVLVGCVTLLNGTELCIYDYAFTLCIIS